MSPFGILILLFAVLVIVLAIIRVFNEVIMKRKQKKDKQDFQSGKKVCIHTREDCENCMVANQCTQVNGKGLLPR